jgi:hypothetical protein
MSSSSVRPSGSSSKTALGWLLSLVIIGALFGGSYLFQQHNDKKKAQENAWKSAKPGECLNLTGRHPVKARIVPCDSPEADGEFLGTALSSAMCQKEYPETTSSIVLESGPQIARCLGPVK